MIYSTQDRNHEHGIMNHHFLAGSCTVPSSRYTGGQTAGPKWSGIQWFNFPRPSQQYSIIRLQYTQVCTRIEWHGLPPCGTGLQRRFSSFVLMHVASLLLAFAKCNPDLFVARHPLMPIAIRNRLMHAQCGFVRLKFGKLHRHVEIGKSRIYETCDGKKRISQRKSHQRDGGLL